MKLNVVEYYLHYFYPFKKRCNVYHIRVLMGKIWNARSCWIPFWLSDQSLFSGFATFSKVADELRQPYLLIQSSWMLVSLFFFHFDPLIDSKQILFAFETMKLLDSWVSGESKNIVTLTSSNIPFWSNIYSKDFYANWPIKSIFARNI